MLSSLTWFLRFASRTTVRPVRPSSSTCCPSSQWRLDLVLSSQVPSFRLTDCPRQKQPLKFYAFSDLKERDKCKTIWQKSHKFHQIFRPRRSTGALFFWGGGTGHCVPSVFANLMFVVLFCFPLGQDVDRFRGALTLISPWTTSSGSLDRFGCYSSNCFTCSSTC